MILLILAVVISICWVSAVNIRSLPWYGNHAVLCSSSGMTFAVIMEKKHW